MIGVHVGPGMLGVVVAPRDECTAIVHRLTPAREAVRPQIRPSPGRCRVVPSLTSRHEAPRRVSTGGPRAGRGPAAVRPRARRSPPVARPAAGCDEDDLGAGRWTSSMPIRCRSSPGRSPGSTSPWSPSWCWSACSAPAGPCSGLVRSPWRPRASWWRRRRPRRRPQPRGRRRGRVARAPGPEIVVHVVGAVRRPGLVRLTEGARVQDALDAAGGLTGAARPGRLNLAQLLTDGQQVVIGTARRPGQRGAGRNRTSGSPRPGPSAATSVDLNRATAAELEQLPGVGPVTAAAILAWRTAARAVHRGRRAAAGRRHRTEDLRADRSARAGVSRRDDPQEPAASARAPRVRPMRVRPGHAPDLRMVPLALAGWAAAALGTWATPTGRADPRAGRGRDRGWWPPCAGRPGGRPPPWCSPRSASPALLHAHRLASGPVAELARAGAVVPVLLEIRTDPVVTRGRRPVGPVTPWSAPPCGRCPAAAGPGGSGLRCWWWPVASPPPPGPGCRSAPR